MNSEHDPPVSSREAHGGGESVLTPAERRALRLGARFEFFLVSDEPDTSVWDAIDTILAADPPANTLVFYECPDFVTADAVTADPALFGPRVNGLHIRAMASELGVRSAAADLEPGELVCWANMRALRYPDLNAGLEVLVTSFINFSLDEAATQLGQLVDQLGDQQRDTERHRVAAQTIKRLTLHALQAAPVYGHDTQERPILVKVFWSKDGQHAITSHMRADELDFAQSINVVDGQATPGPVNEWRHRRNLHDQWRQRFVAVLLTHYCLDRRAEPVEPKKEGEQAEAIIEAEARAQENMYTVLQTVSALSRDGLESLYNNLVRDVTEVLSEPNSDAEHLAAVADAIWQILARLPVAGDEQR